VTPVSSSEYSFDDEIEARNVLESQLPDLDSADTTRLQAILEEAFKVRRTLLSLPPDTRVGDSRQIAQRYGRLTDICITANERYLFPALAAIGVEFQVELRVYPLQESSAGLPRFHMYAILEMSGSELIIDVNADPFYDRDIGVIISPSRAGLYNQGTVVHRRRVGKDSRIFSEFFTYDGRLYFRGDDLRYLTVANYFLGSDSNYCPIIISDSTTLYLSYARSFFSGEWHDLIDIGFVARMRAYDYFLWSFALRNVAFFQVLPGDSRSFQVEFVDKSRLEIELDKAGFPI
jgi:hypothetical protein